MKKILIFLFFLFLNGEILSKEKQVYLKIYADVPCLSLDNKNYQLDKADKFSRHDYLYKDPYFAGSKAIVFNGYCDDKFCYKVEPIKFKLPKNTYKLKIKLYTTGGDRYRLSIYRKDQEKDNWLWKKRKEHRLFDVRVISKVTNNICVAKKKKREIKKVQKITLK